MSLRRRAAVASVALAALLLPSATSPNNFARQSQTPARQTTAEADARGDGLVTLHVTVVGKGDALVGGLPRESFGVFEGKEAREVVRFERDVPASVGVVVDISGSLHHKLYGKRLEAVREGVKRFVRGGHPENQYFLGTFGTRVGPFTDWTRDADTLASAVVPARSQEQTALFDACFEAVEQLSRGAHAKRVLLLISDGQDNASRRRFPELRRLLQTSGVLVYALSPGLIYDQTAYGVGGASILGEMAGVSGGEVLLPDYGQQVLNAFARVAETLRFQYLVAFAPAAPEAKEKWRKVKVKVQPPADAAARGLKDLRVVTRDGYLTPPAAQTTQTKKSN